jgi:hypothetical protein
MPCSVTSPGDAWPSAGFWKSTNFKNFSLMGENVRRKKAKF